MIQGYGIDLKASFFDLLMCDCDKTLWLYNGKKQTNRRNRQAKKYTKCYN